MNIFLILVSVITGEATEVSVSSLDVCYAAVERYQDLKLGFAICEIR